MRNAVAHHSPHGLCARHLFLAVVLLGAVCAAPTLPVVWAENAASQPAATQASATSQPEVRTRTRSAATQPVSTQPASMPAGSKPVATPPGSSAPAKKTSLQSAEWTELVGVFVVFAVLISVLLYAWKYSRDKALAKLTPEEEEPPFTLDELRQLRDSGQISQEEFLRARAIVLEKERRRLIEEAGEGDSNKNE